jgi:hypothetical protein
MRRKNALLSLVFLVCALVASDAYGVSVSVPSTSGFLLASSTDTPGAPFRSCSGRPRLSEIQG